MEMDHPVHEVAAVIGFYYKNLRQKLSSLESPSVQIENLGTFYIKEKALDSDILKANRISDSLSGNTIQEYAMKQNIKSKQEMMVKVKGMLDLERLRRRSVIEKRFGNGPEK